MLIEMFQYFELNTHDFLLDFRVDLGKEKDNV